MNGEKFVLDTDVTINYLKKTEVAFRFVREKPDAEFYVSVLTRMELLSYHGLSAEEENHIYRFLNIVSTLPLNDEIERTAIALRRQTRRKLPDAVIAATAVRLGATLATVDEQLSKTEYPGLRAIRIVEPG